MVVFEKYAKSKEDLDFLNLLHGAVETRTELHLQYKNYACLFEPQGENIDIWHEGERVAQYESLDDLLLHFMLDGKPFIERLDDLTEY